MSMLNMLESITTPAANTVDKAVAETIVKEASATTDYEYIMFLEALLEAHMDVNVEDLRESAAEYTMALIEESNLPPNIVENVKEVEKTTITESQADKIARMI